MKIIATSDLHAQLPENVPAGDLLLIAGDILPEEGPERWLREEFAPWLQRLDIDRTLFIAGNHDFYFQSPAWRQDSYGVDYFRSLGAVYLQDSGIEIGGLSFWGTPWLDSQSRWAFSDQRQAQQAYRRIPENTDILLSHGPPAGILDQLVTGQNVGSTALASRLQRVAPRAVLFGHIHECRGQSQKIGASYFHNVAYCDQWMAADQHAEPRQIAY